jgi:phosphate starvation-inducible PhoH-like protein
MNIKYLLLNTIILPKIIQSFQKKSIFSIQNRYKFLLKKNDKLFSKNKTNNFIISKNDYKPKTYNQKEYKNSLENSKINLIVCCGPAGTGKTLLACQYAIESLINNNINKIIITRPAICIDENIGYLPGNIQSKMQPWMIPIYDIFEEYYSKKDLNQLINDNIIEICPLTFIQGRTFKNSIVIADEMQNSTPNQMFMLLTRLGIKSKMIITGDLEQTYNKNNGLNDINNKLTSNYPTKKEMNDDSIDLITLTKSDIQRSNIVKVINNLYKD